ncbi:MAG: VOC family protein [Chloroflexi bacterium]|nr:VOC family protein [Chloroflexota bacterium]
MITDIRYVAVMVESLDEGVKVWQGLFGLEPVNQPTANAFGIRAQMLGQKGQPVIEVMEPASPSSALARMMEERKNPRNPRGEGIYMIAVEVDDLAKTIKEIEAKGGRVAREEGNTNVAWVHPLSLHQVFIELQQRGTGSQGAAGGGERR